VVGAPAMLELQWPQVCGENEMRPRDRPLPLLAKRRAEDAERVVGASGGSRCSGKVVEFGTRTATSDQDDWLSVWRQKSEKG